MQLAIKLLLGSLAALLVLTPSVQAALLLKPGFTFNNRVQATLWGAQVAALQIRYNSQDPNVSAVARKEVDVLATEFQAKYKMKWDPNEEEEKKKVFTENLWKISQINLQSNKTGWWAAQTKFADLTEKEFARKYLMNDFKEPPTYDKLIKVPGRFILGSGVDWDAKRKVTPVKDQLSCGSCWAMAANAALESRYLIKRGLTSPAYSINLAEQQLLDCVTSPRTSTTGAVYTSGGCAGGWSQEAFDYVRKYNVTLTANYPYNGVNGVCKQRVLTSSGLTARALKQMSPDPGYYQITSSNVTAMKVAVGYTPIVFYMRVEGPFHLYSGGVFSTPCTGSNINHAMLIYGYYIPPLLTQPPYWKVKNSWGQFWGESGKIKIKMDTSASSLNNGLCNMHVYSFYPNDNSQFYPLRPILKP